MARGPGRDRPLRRGGGRAFRARADDLRFVGAGFRRGKPDPMTDEAAEPQPEHEEPRLEDPGPTDHSKRDYSRSSSARAKGKRGPHHEPRRSARLLRVPGDSRRRSSIAAGIFGLSPARTRSTRDRQAARDHPEPGVRPGSRQPQPADREAGHEHHADRRRWRPRPLDFERRDAERDVGAERGIRPRRDARVRPPPARRRRDGRLRADGVGAGRSACSCSARTCPAGSATRSARRPSSSSSGGSRSGRS